MKNDKSPALAADRAPIVLYSLDWPQDHRLFLTEKTLNLLRENQAPWQKPWNPDADFAPFNPVSGLAYRGLNRLALIAMGLPDPRWVSFKQARAANLILREKARALSVEFWRWSERVTIRSLDNLLDKSPAEPVTAMVEYAQPRVRYFSVYNYADLTDWRGAPPPPRTRAKPKRDPTRLAEEIARKSGAALSFDRAEGPFYSARADRIRLPPWDRFASTAAFFSAFFRELARWTGHKTRLAREMGARGTEERALEELRAQIASWALSIDLGLAFVPARDSASASQWIAIFLKRPYAFPLAVSAAERIKDYILEISAVALDPLV
ncbi:MAG: ssDNA-binding domain-containing protein [Deltaproteobacteria bacterium]|nr:ssDNA-binding domain-containing protein [Deltaproteobacteria bacterium]